MATDDKSKKRKASTAGDAPTKKKRAAASASDESVPTGGSIPEPDAEAEAARSSEGADDDPEANEPEGALVVRGGESISLSDDGQPLLAGAGLAAARTGEDEELDDDAPATQLGAERYVMAAFFAAGLIGAYILGKTIHGIWSSLSSHAWFTNAVPSLAAVGDEEKTTIGMVIGGVVALFVAIRSYRRPDVRGWADDVASELTKVKWPTKKDVINSTIVVISASAVATVYLALLDRLWAFITNLVYGTGS